MTMYYSLYITFDTVHEYHKKSEDFLGYARELKLPSVWRTNISKIDPISRTSYVYFSVQLDTDDFSSDEEYYLMFVLKFGKSSGQYSNLRYNRYDLIL